MLKGKMGLGIASVALVGAIAVGGTLAWFTNAADTTNVVTFGNVKIEAKAPTEPFSLIVPGDEIAALATIENTGANDAYIRAKVVVGGIEDAEAAEVIAALAIADGWTLNEADGYYYYKDVVAPAANAVTVFDQVTIPTSWTNDMADANFNVKLNAEAIQADNFTPNFAADAPWGDVVVEGNAVAPEPAPEA